MARTYASTNVFVSIGFYSSAGKHVFEQVCVAYRSSCINWIGPLWGLLTTATKEVHVFFNNILVSGKFLQTNWPQQVYKWNGSRSSENIVRIMTKQRDGAWCA